MGTYQLFGKDGPDFGGMMSLPGVPISSWMYYFRTGYIDAAVKRFAEADDTVINGPMQVPGGD